MEEPALQLVIGGFLDESMRAMIAALVSAELFATVRDGVAVETRVSEKAEDFLRHCEVARVDLAVIVFNPTLRLGSGWIDDGVGFVAEFCAEHDCPVIVMANGVDYGPEHAELFVRAGVRALLGFPFSRAEFREALRRAELL